MNYGKRFKYFREKCKMTQSQAAAVIGVKNYQLGNYETNRSEPTLTTLKKMSALYGVTIDMLLGNSVKHLNQGGEDGDRVNVGDLVDRLNQIAEELNAYAVENKLE